MLHRQISVSPHLHTNFLYLLALRISPADARRPKEVKQGNRDKNILCGHCLCGETCFGLGVNEICFRVLQFSRIMEYIFAP